MDGDVKKTADWEPGTLDKTRKNIGEIDATEAANMAKNLAVKFFMKKQYLRLLEHLQEKLLLNLLGLGNKQKAKLKIELILL